MANEAMTRTEGGYAVGPTFCVGLGEAVNVVELTEQELVDITNVLHETIGRLPEGVAPRLEELHVRLTGKLQSLRDFIAAGDQW